MAAAIAAESKAHVTASFGFMIETSAIERLDLSRMRRAVGGRFSGHAMTVARIHALQLRAMKIITDEACLRYEKPGHPERPARVARTVALLREQRELPIVWER